MASLTDTDRLRPLRTFVVNFTQLLDRDPEIGPLLEQGATLLADLISTDDWLPDEFAAPQPDHYVQNLLHCDVSGRFSVVASIWGPGQSTPPHDHMTWGLVGVLRGAEIAQWVTRQSDGSLDFGALRLLKAGDIDVLSEANGDTHIVSNAFTDRTSISIHVYGGNIGLIDRHILVEGATDRPFRSGYSNSSLPNIWAAEG